MNRPAADPTENQPASLGLVVGALFDALAARDHVRNVVLEHPALKHALHGVDAVDQRFVRR